MGRRVAGVETAVPSAPGVFRVTRHPRFGCCKETHVSLRQRSSLQSFAVVAVRQVSIEKPAVSADERGDNL
jgi:hypothetical protein